MKQLSGNTLLMKEINTNLIRQALKNEHTATKQHLAKITGLSFVTVGSVLTQLIANQEVYEDTMVPSNGGRPAHTYCYNSRYKHAIILYAYEKDGKDTICAKVIDLYGNCIDAVEVVPTDITITTFEQIITKMISKYPKVQGISLGLSGSESNGSLEISDYKNINGIPFTAYFKNRFQLPVCMENDANAAALGYCKKNGLMEKETVIYLYFPQIYPPGAGIMIDGSLLLGKSNFAGEIKHLPLGIDWEHMEYDDHAFLCDAVSRLVLSFTAMVNPDKIILNGAFLTPRHLEDIQKLIEGKIAAFYLPQLLLSDSFLSDFEHGIIDAALNLIETNTYFYSNEPQGGLS